MSIALGLFLFSCASKSSSSIQSMNDTRASSKNAKPPLLAPRTSPAQWKTGPRIEEQFGTPLTLGRPDRLQYAIFAGGCFWCLEGVYELVPGVEDVVSGYEGGTAASPTYEEVSTGTTGYAESVLILFDPTKVSYSELLDIFWHIHDPTTKDRQGYDIGPQYRSAIFYLNETQKAEARASVQAQGELWPAPIVTEIRPASLFWPAEDYHQDFYSKNPTYGYCQAIITPKVEKVFQTK
jgi:peptide-methionine (S)-S-oxide reductase